MAVFDSPRLIGSAALRSPLEQGTLKRCAETAVGDAITELEILVDAILDDGLNLVVEGEAHNLARVDPGGAFHHLVERYPVFGAELIFVVQTAGNEKGRVVSSFMAGEMPEYASPNSIPNCDRTPTLSEDY